MRRRLYVLSLVAFVALAMPKASFGVAWPSVADDLALPIGDLGLVVAVYIGGYFVTAMLSGHLTRRFGTGTSLVLAAWVSVAALAGYALAPGPGILLTAAFVLGLSGGLIDPAINTQVSLRHGARAMGMLHAAFGIGGTLGPLLMTMLLGFDRSWRWGFLIIAVLQAVIAVGLTIYASGWATSPSTADPLSGFTGVPRSTVAVLTLLVFAAYGGVEIGVGQWAYSLLTEGRGVGTGAAGLAVTGFWAGLTVSRLSLGVVGDRLDAARTTGVCAVVALGATAVLWWSPSSGAGITALVVAGVALGPIFPLHTLLTPLRVGTGATASMVGYQLGAATIGSVAIPGAIGILVADHGLEVAGPVLTGSAAALVVASEALRRRSPAVHVPAATPPPPGPAGVV